MNNFIQFDALISPVALGRPRVNTNSKSVYYRRADRDFYNQLAYIAKCEMGYQRRELLTGAIRADISLYRNLPVTSKNFGDIDNHLKAIFDALTGIVYADDSQIIEVHAFKFRHCEEFIRLKFSPV